MGIKAALLAAPENFLRLLNKNYHIQTLNLTGYRYLLYFHKVNTARIYFDSHLHRFALDIKTDYFKYSLIY